MRYLMLALAAVSLSGCTWFTKETTVTVEVPVEILCEVKQRADPFVHRNTDPTVLQDNDGKVWIAFTVQHYENMALNLQDVLTHIRQKNAILANLEECIAVANQKVLEYHGRSE